MEMSFHGSGFYRPELIVQIFPKADQNLFTFHSLHLPIAASLSGRSLLNSVPGHSVPDLVAGAGGGPDDEPR